MKKSRKAKMTAKTETQRTPSEAVSADMSGRGAILLSSAILAVITLAVYWQVGGHEFITFDDGVYVTENIHVKQGITLSNIIWAFTALDVMYWSPVTLLSHMADVQMYGMNPAGHHLTSVFVHTVTALLLFLTLSKITKTVWRSLFVATLFALHPLHVESVAWIAERKDVLSAFFWILTLLLYALYVEKRTTQLYLLTLASFMLGLMSKPMVVTLPVVMLLMDFWPLYRCDLNNTANSIPRLKVLLKEKVPFFACSVLSSAVTVYGQHKIGAMIDSERLPVFFRIQNAVVSYIKYVAKTLWPNDLAVYYPLPLTIPQWQFIGSLTVLLLATGLILGIARRHPYLLTGWFWFIVTLLPVIGLTQAGAQALADRFTYIPHIGLFVMAAWGIPALVKDAKTSRIILSVPAVAVIIASAILTWRQIGYWRDGVTLFSHTLRVTKNNIVIQDNLGLSYVKKGDIDAAIREFRAALAINPNHADAHSDLGSALYDKGELDAAYNELQASLRINPKLVDSHNTLGAVYLKKGEIDAAITEFKTALEIEPDYVKARNNLGGAYFKKGDLDAAIREFKALLAINPAHAAAKTNLGYALEEKAMRGKSND